MSSVSSASEDSSQNKYSEVREVSKILLVPITSNRGLCGGFNANIIKKTIEIEKELNSKSELTILSIGKSLQSFLKKTSTMFIQLTMMFFKMLTMKMYQKSQN